MAFTLPADLATNWADGVGMIENAAFLNAVATLNNANKAALNTLVNGAATATVATSETTVSTTYADLATTTDSVTVTIGNSGMALVLLQANGTSTASNYSYTGFAISGATTRAADDAVALQYSVWSSGIQTQAGAPFLVTGLTAGSTTFKMKYRVAGGTGTFLNRRISVIPFP